jgi:hypothetical protein
MEYNIRQLSFGEVLDRSLRILVDNAVLLIGIAVFLGMPIIALGRGGRAAGIFFLAFLLVMTPLVHAALTSAITDTYLNRPVTIASAYKVAWSLLLPFIGTYLLLYLIIGLVAGGVGVIAFLVSGAARASSGPFIALLLLVAIPATLYFTVRWVLIAPTMIVEGRFGLVALNRSAELVKGVWWRTLGIVFVAALVVRVPLSALQLFWSSVPILGTILSGLVASIGYAYSAIALLVYYFDRRCRLEDFDLHRLAEQIRSESAQGGAVMTGAPTVD